MNLSPENYFFANADTLYVADSGAPKNTSADSPLGDGGVEKWTLSGGTWTLDYTLSAGLDLVANSGTSGSTGLDGVYRQGHHRRRRRGGRVVRHQLHDWRHRSDLSLRDHRRALGDLAAQAGESFVELEQAPADATFKGIAFAPAPAPKLSTWAMMLLGFVGLGFFGFEGASRNRGAGRSGLRRINLAKLRGRLRP